MVSTKDPGGSALERLREFGLRYPGAHTKSPWPGHLDLAVNDKTFAYLSIAGEPLKVSCKLPRSADAALELPFTTPTAYGLGKSGWVTAEFPDGADVPVELLEEWIDESYRAQAPKRASAGLPPFRASAQIGSDDGAAAPPKSSTRGATRRGAARRSTVKRSAAGATKRTAGESPKRATSATSASTKPKSAAPRSAPRAAQRGRASKPTPSRSAPKSTSVRRASKLEPAVARSTRATKRAGGNQRTTKRPAKKRARAA